MARRKTLTREEAIVRGHFKAMRERVSRHFPDSYSSLDVDYFIEGKDPFEDNVDEQSAAKPAIPVNQQSPSSTDQQAAHAPVAQPSPTLSFEWH